MATYDQRYQHVTHQYNAEHITTIQGISEERHERLAEELGVTRSALRSFFKILEQQQVPPEDLDHTLRQIATSYKDLHAKLQRFTSDDPAVMALKQQARDALEAGEFARAEALLNEASAKDLEAAQQLQEMAATRLSLGRGLPGGQWGPQADPVGLCRGGRLLPAGRRSGGVRPHGEAGTGRIPERVGPGLL